VQAGHGNQRGVFRVAIHLMYGILVFADAALTDRAAKVFIYYLWKTPFLTVKVDPCV
jgi:hypothetical protein